MLLVATATIIVQAAAPNGSGTYYQNANGKKGSALKTALRGIIYNRTEKTYNYLWTAFQTTDVRSDGKIWDMYSNITNYTPVTSGSSYSAEGDSYNREHSFPQSWFGSNTPMYTDLHHIYPTDGYVNGKRSNYPFGETTGVGKNGYKSANDFSKLGPCSLSGYSGTVFEPADEYKGDFARTYFYMVTCYEEKLHDWYTNYSSTDVVVTIDGSTYPALQLWQLNMLLKWAKNDPVSQKEIDRNNAVYGIQNNRNPFIDYPGLEQYIWGSKKDDTFSYDNYVTPTEYSTEYNSGSGSGGGETPSGEGGTYKLTITVDDFNSTSYAANNNEKTSNAVCTTDNTKTYEVKWTSNQVMNQSSTMQWQKNTGYIYNSTDLGTISSVTITSTEGTFTTYYGTSAQPSSSTTVGGGYFKINVGGAVGKTSKIEVVFTIPDPTPPAKTDPSFSGLADLSVDFVSTLTLTQGTTGTPNVVTDGTVTLTSSNEAVVTVSGLTITPVAVGTAIITINAAASENYNAGSTMAEITVNAPEGQSTAAPSTGGGTNILLFGESFGDNSGSARAWSDSYSVKSGVSAVYSGASYTVTNAKQSKNTMGQTGSALVASQGQEGMFVVGPLNVASYSSLTVSNYFGMSSGSWNAGSYMKLFYSTNDVDYTEVSRTDSNTPSGAVSSNSNLVQATYNLPQAAQSSTLYLKFEFYCYQKNKNDLEIGQAYLDGVTITGEGTATIPVTLNSYGYATYCSEYPLDFSDYATAGYSAWYITGINGSAITFSQITGSVKGGTGLFLMGTPGATVTLTSVASSNELSGNLLKGTLAPTYVGAGEVYGLKNNQFVPSSSAGKISAGKAYLDAEDIPDVSEAKALIFVFEDTTTGIEAIHSEDSSMNNGQWTMDNAKIFNLAGQRLDNSQLRKGIYIVNGKKVLVK